jgi:hypothetical protein
MAIKTMSRRLSAISELKRVGVVIMDNLSSRKGPRVRQIIEAAGAELRSLPPSSPDFNPIEKRLRKAQGGPPKCRQAQNQRSVGHYGPHHRSLSAS